MRGGGRSYAAAVARCKEERDIGGGPLMAADLEERPSDVAHHLVEEAVPLKLEAEERVVVDDVEPGEGADWIARGRPFVGLVREGGEVVGPDEERRGCADERDVERRDEVRAGAAVERVEGVAELERVVVDFAGGVVAGMEGGGGGLAGEDSDVGRKERVDGEDEAER